ncbi:hypothetical protein [Amycolatopsis thermoflava]|uniref:hypothetical protein n=1 Tax=Amycolatopsis thermoflava TaxID=84480 RepID=UPI003656FBCC
MRPPLAADGDRFRLYSRALRDLARPKLLDNRVSYRLAEVDWTGDKGRLGFSYTTYFDVLDVCEAAAHEFADAWLRAGRKRPSPAHLPLRRHIADPFDLLARPMPLSINTLTIRRDPIDGHRMYLHRRDAKATAVAGGMFHVIPAGVFQPAALAPAHQANDFSLWRNIQREYSEEFLGNPEHDGNALDPIDYEHDEPFRSFAAARAAGDFRVFTCAVVLKPLTLWVESRERLKSEPLSPISRTCIELASQHRNTHLATRVCAFSSPAPQEALTSSNGGWISGSWATSCPTTTGSAPPSRARSTSRRSGRRAGVLRRSTTSSGSR